MLGHMTMRSRGLQRVYLPTRRLEGKGPHFMSRDSIRPLTRIPTPLDHHPSPLTARRQRAEAAERAAAASSGRATGGGFGAVNGVHAAGLAQELQRQVSALQQQLIFAQEEVSE